jgi:hypothetical protein
VRGHPPICVFVFGRGGGAPPCRLGRRGPIIKSKGTPKL